MYWVKILHCLKRRIKKNSFQNWFRPTHQVSENDQEIKVLVPNPFFRQVIESSYLEEIQKCVKELGLKEKRIIFVTNDEWNGSAADTNTSSQTTLNPYYTFENFVVGASNQAAYAACRAVADTPGMLYNPLFIYGGVGLGKTHLLNAVGNEVLKTKPQLHVTYVSCDTFMNQLIDAFRTGKVSELRSYYRSTDILLLDDVHTLAGRDRTQEEIFSIFNLLYQSNKQIILTADQPPTQIKKVKKRLISRFCGGVVLDIHPPEFEIRVAILQKKAQLSGVQLPNNVAYFLAENITQNIRELEGALKSLIFLSSIQSEPISLNLAKKVIRSLIGTGPSFSLQGNGLRSRISPQTIVEKVSTYFGIPVQQVLSRSHRPNVVLPRQVSMYIMRNFLEYSLTDIARFFGKHHTTVMHSIQKIEDMISTNSQLRGEIEDLWRRLMEEVGI